MRTWLLAALPLTMVLLLSSTLLLLHVSEGRPSSRRARDAADMDRSETPEPDQSNTTTALTTWMTYTGKKRYNESCWPNGQVAAMLLRSGATVIGTALEDNVCSTELGLECRPVSVETQQVADSSSGEEPATAVEYLCRCMLALGKRGLFLPSYSSCFIPAGRGAHSQCFAREIGFNKPAGYDRRGEAWTKIRLRCVPHALCQEGESYAGKRCVCQEGVSSRTFRGICSRGHPLRRPVLLDLNFLLVFIIIYTFQSLFSHSYVFE